MVTFYGAGERTGIMNVESKLAKALGNKGNILVVKASDRDKVLSEISARAARYQKWNPELYDELMVLRKNIKQVFDKGLDPGLDLMESLYFLDATTKSLVSNLTKSYDMVVTPNDFKAIAKIMSEHLSEEVPILRDFTKYFGRLAAEFMQHAKPKESEFDWKAIALGKLFGNYDKGFVPSDNIAKLLGIKPKTPLSEALLSLFEFWRPNGNMAMLLKGVEPSKLRRTGGKYIKIAFKLPMLNLKKLAIGKEATLLEFKLFTANKLPKSWTHIPWVNFDGKTIEQHFTQVFEERLIYKNPDGTYSNNIIQVPQKSDYSWWDEVSGGQSNKTDIADVTRAQTAYGVNGNHSKICCE